MTNTIPLCAKGMSLNGCGLLVFKCRFIWSSVLYKLTVMFCDNIEPI